jgi:threonine-phosphate decarboxylase
MEKHLTELHPHGHGGDLQTAAQLAGFEAEELIDFSASINPLGPPAGLFAYLAESLPAITAYPDPACRRLCSAIAERYPLRYEPVPGNGAGELIYLAMRAVPAGAVLIPVPTFSLYAKGALAAGRSVVQHGLRESRGYRLDTEELCDHILRLRPALTVICNPNNPTGDVLARDEALALAEACAKVGGYLLVDEAFLEFCSDWHRRTLLQETPANVLVLSSLTKMYAIPGLRLGFLVAPPVVAARVRELRDPWSVSTLAQLAGEYVLRDKHFVERSMAAVAGLAGELAASLAGMPGLRVWQPTVNYIFMETLRDSSEVLQQRLLQEKILIRDCGNFAGLTHRYLRAVVRTAEENQFLLQAMNNVLSNGGNHEAVVDSPR